MLNLGAFVIMSLHGLQVVKVVYRELRTKQKLIVCLKLLFGKLRILNQVDKEHEFPLTWGLTNLNYFIKT